MTDSGETCPVCDSAIAPGAKNCDVCGADLSLVRGGASQVFVCPECGTEILEQDSRCPKCGAQFAVEEQVVFQCPVCNAEVGANENRCPKCGVEFLSEEEVQAGGSVPEPVASVPNVTSDSAPEMAEFEEQREQGRPENAIEEMEQLLSIPDEPPQKSESVSFPPAAESAPPVQHEAATPPAPVKGIPTANEAQAPRKKKFLPFLFGRKGKKEGRNSAGQNLHTLTEQRDAEPQLASTEMQAGKAQKDGAAASSKEMIEEIRGLLKFTAEARINIDEGKRYLDMSVELARESRHEEASRYVALARRSVIDGIEVYFSERISVLQKQLEIEKVRDERRKMLMQKISGIAEMVNAGRYREAYSAVAEFQSELSPQASIYGEARETLDETDSLLTCADELGMDYSAARMIFNEARKMLAVGEWNQALVLARQARESLLRHIPEKLSGEMAQAKSDVIDAKINGLPVSELISTLKSAGESFNEGRFDDTLRFMNAFMKDFERLKMQSEPAEVQTPGTAPRQAH